MIFISNNKKTHEEVSQPLFSVLIAQYNNGRFFDDCYKSIMGQTYKNWEVIIVDDGSEDDSVETIKKTIGKDPRFKLFLNDENKGCGYTKRRCVELAKGEICGFVDPDDAITETAVDEMVKKHTALPDVSLVYSNFVYCDENLSPQRVHYGKAVENQAMDFFNFKGEISHFATFKKSFYDKTVGIDPYLQKAVDKDLYGIMYEAGDVFYIDLNLYLYRIHEGGISTLQNENKAYYWFWVSIIHAAKRRKISVEELFLSKFSYPERQAALEREIAAYNQSIIFKILRKLKFFKI